MKIMKILNIYATAFHVFPSLIQFKQMYYKLMMIK